MLGEQKTKVLSSIQKSIDAMSRGGGGIHRVPSCRIAMNEPLIIRRGVTLCGTGRVGFDHTRPGIMGGSIFEIASSNEPAIILESGAAIAGIGFDYPLQDAAANQPIEMPPTIKLGERGFGGYDQSITGCTFYKSYCAIDARGSTLGNVPLSNLTISGNRGATLNSFLELDYLADWGNFSGNNLNAGRIAPLALKEGLVRWTSEAGAVFRIGGCDWLKLNDNQAWGYHIGVCIVGAQGYHGSGPYTVEGNQFDACRSGVELTGRFLQAVRIHRNILCPFNAATGERGVAINAQNGSEISTIEIVGNHAFGPMDHFLWLGWGGEHGGSQIVDLAKVFQNDARTENSRGYGMTFGKINRLLQGDNTMRGFAAPRSPLRKR